MEVYRKSRLLHSLGLAAAGAKRHTLNESYDVALAIQGLLRKISQDGPSHWDFLSKWLARWKVGDLEQALIDQLTGKNFSPKEIEKAYDQFVNSFHEKLVVHLSQLANEERDEQVSKDLLTIVKKLKSGNRIIELALVVELVSMSLVQSLIPAAHHYNRYAWLQKLAGKPYVDNNHLIASVSVMALRRLVSAIVGDEKESPFSPEVQADLKLAGLMDFFKTNVDTE